MGGGAVSQPKLENRFREHAPFLNSRLDHLHAHPSRPTGLRWLKENAIPGFALSIFSFDMSYNFYTIPPFRTPLRNNAT